MKKMILGSIIASTLSLSTMTYAMTNLDDATLSNVTGQALFSLSKVSDSSQGLDFFKLGFDAELSLNTNIKSLQLGCGGDNGNGGCDIDISQLSFGCVTNASGTCITLTGAAGQPTGTDNNNAVSNQAALKDFVLTNPFYQFAIKGGSQASTRQIVGVRVGAEKAEGPMSIGTMNSFSGYLTGKTNLNILAQTNIAVTCQGGTAGCSSSDASKFSGTAYGMPSSGTVASAYLGVKDAEVLNLLGIKVRYKDLTVDTKSSSSNADVSAAGTRLTQVKIANLALGNTVDGVVEGLKVNQSCANSIFGGCNILTGADMSNALLPLLKTGIKTYMKQQTMIGLGLAVPAQGSLSNDDYSVLLTNTLNAYQLPYNLSNVHQLDVNSDKFGIALTSLASIKYPGYDSAVGKGWSMYLQDAFTLNITDSLTSLMSNMVQNGNAAAGNITTLAPAYRNCFGSSRFC